jgi:octaprenyl-diphosphate synthase
MDNLELELIEQLRSKVPVAFEIGAHIMNSGGKRVRPQMAVICAQMGGAPGDDPIRLAAAIECIHTATLLHDDVVDTAKSRRGRPAANTVWSNEMCVLGGDFILARAFSLLTQIGDLKVLKIVSNATVRLSEGELFQMSNIGNLDLTEEQYLQVISDKTAILMEAACRGGATLGGLSSENEEALASYGWNLGIAFQMTDDVIDYISEKAVMGKAPGKDLEEGKLTLPMILALKEADPEEKSQAQRIITQGRVSDYDLAWVRDFLKRRGGIDQTLDRARQYLNEASTGLSVFPASPQKDALQKLCQKILNRTY